MGLLLLENVSDNQVSEPARMAVEDELSGLFVARTPGDRLEASRWADQQARAEREEDLRRRLGRLHRLDAMAHHGAVIAGFLEILTFVLVAMAALGSPDIAGIGALGMGTACLGLLGISGAAVSVGAWMRRRLLKDAERNAVVLPNPRTVPAEAGWEGECQEKLNRAYRDQRILSKICLWSGQCALAIWGILALLFGARNWVESDPGLPGMLLYLILLVVVCVVLIVSAATLFILPFVAPISAFHWYRRKRMLQEAGQLGYDVRDPARYPGD